MASKQPKPQPAKARRTTVKSPLPEQCKRLGKYEIVRKIGAGGMGAVYLAKDTELKRTVALKVLPKERAENPTLVKRFRSEARTAAQLKHDNIVTVYEAGEADGYLYIALEYVDGIDVHDLVHKRGVIPVRRSIEIIKQVARALQHAHQQGIVHRDIKPSNLLVTRDGTVKLTDMGLARSVDDTTRSNITRAGTTVGTVDYMPPEQARSSKAADIRSDIYSLGCTWYHMLTGHPPYPEGDLVNKLHAHATKPPPDPRDENPSVPESVVAVIHRMMAKKPEDRYQTPAELLADLENAMLSREEVTDRLLEALADDESNGPSRPTATASVTGTSVSGPLPLPPREDSVTARKPKKASREKRKWQLPDLEPLKWVAIVMGGLACLVGLGYVVSQYGASLDQPQSAVATVENPFAEEETEPAPDETALQSDQPARGLSRKDHAAEAAEKKSSEAGESSSAAAEPPWSEQTAPEPIVVSTQKWKLFLSDPAGLVRKGEGVFLPRWARQIADATGPTRLTAFTVDEDCLFDTRLPTLNDVLADLPSSGGVVELQGDGPFFLKPVQLKDCGNVWLRAAEGSRPIVVLVPGPGAVPPALVSVQEGSLTFHNLHFVVLADQFATSEPLAMLAARDADLAAVGCSWSLRGIRPGPTVALSIERANVQEEGRPKKLDRAPRVCLERVVIRGEQLQPLDVQREDVDVCVLASLLVTRRGSIVRISRGPATGPARSASLASKPPGTDPFDLATQDRARAQTTRNFEKAPQRSLLFLSTTMVCGGPGFVFQAMPEVDEPVQTTLKTVNSVVAASAGRTGDREETALVKVSHWPRTGAAGGFARLQCLLLHSGVAGWRRLVDGDEGFTVRDPAAWAELWQADASSVEFRASSRQVSFGRSFDTVQPEQFDPDTGPTWDVRATDGQTLGCDVRSLVVPASIAMKRAELFAGRTHFPKRIDAARIRTVRLNLEKEDLGRVLSETDWSGGGVVIVAGRGEHFSSPIEIRGGFVRIDFEQTANEPLVVLPRARPPGSQTKDDAFITVENGSIEIVNGVFAFGATRRNLHPEWFLRVTRGSFCLRKCEIRGPTSPPTRCKGLIRWAGPASPGSSPLARLIGGSGIIVDSYLASPGIVIDGDLDAKTLFVRNSVLSSPKSLLRGRLLVPPDQPATLARQGSLADIRHATLSARVNFFDIRTEEANPARLTFLVDHSVFVPSTPARREANVTTLLAASAALLENGQIDWWGDSNSFSDQLDMFVRDPKAPLAGNTRQSFQEAWQERWGGNKVSQAKTGASAAKLSGPLPNASELQLDHFRLPPSVGAGAASAVGASGGKQRLGADVSRVGLGDRRRAGVRSGPPRKDQRNVPNRRRVRVRRQF